MKSRCNNPRSDHYENYGGRGIAVCKRWQQSFWSFVDDRGPRPDGLTLERINNDGDYTPGNCCWASQKQQCKNMRRNVRVNTRIGLLTISEIAEIAGTSSATVRGRIERGWGIDDVLLPPNEKTSVRIDTPKGHMTITEASKLSGIRWDTLKNRVDSGWPVSRLFSQPSKVPHAKR